tara:strand:- start:156 stop:1241 length:1086 start_codon:yes stop_codon:yes gene_type:complete
MNNNIRGHVQNQLVVNILRVLLIIYCAFVVPVLKQKHVSVVDQQVVRFILVAIIIYLSFIDLPSAILLTIAFLLTLQKVDRVANGNGNNSSQVNSVSLNSLITSLNKGVPAVDNNKMAKNSAPVNNSAPNNVMVNGHQVENFEAHNNVNNANKVNSLEEEVVNNVEELVKNNTVTGNVNNAVNKVEGVAANLVGNNISNLAKAQNNKTINDSGDILGENVPMANDNSEVNKLQVFDNNNAAAKNNGLNVNKAMNNNEVLEQVNAEQPASETLTEGILRAQGAQRNNNAPVGLTTGDDLYSVQENAVPGSNIMGEVKSLQEQHATQNLGRPMGLGAKRYDGYHFRDDRHPNLEHAMLRNENL